MVKSKPILLATLGHPGSGKTFFARRFAKEFNYVHLNSDHLRLEIYGEPTYSEFESECIFRIMDYMTEMALYNGVNVIYDANTTMRADRAAIRRLVKKNGGVYLMLWFQTPIDIALRRTQKRAGLKAPHLKKHHRSITKAVFEKVIKKTEVPTVKEPHLTIDGTLNYEQMKEIVLKQLTS